MINEPQQEDDDHQEENEIDGKERRQDRGSPRTAARRTGGAAENSRWSLNDRQGKSTNRKDKRISPGRERKRWKRKKTGPWEFTQHEVRQNLCDDDRGSGTNRNNRKRTKLMEKKEWK